MNIIRLYVGRIAVSIGRSVDRKLLISPVGIRYFAIINRKITIFDHITLEIQGM